MAGQIERRAAVMVAAPLSRRAQPSDAKRVLDAIPERASLELRYPGAQEFSRTTRNVTFDALWKAESGQLAFGFSDARLNAQAATATVRCFDDASGRLLVTATPSQVQGNTLRAPELASAFGALPTGTAIRTVITFQNPETGTTHTLKAQGSFVLGETPGWMKRGARP
ncbi:MAG: hypothetical protein K1X89_08510 [Myxococcaceae bacterium]|nr:hypothetical protein [Myxococcaceae bacterium]